MPRDLSGAVLFDAIDKSGQYRAAAALRVACNAGLLEDLTLGTYDWRQSTLRIREDCSECSLEELVEAILVLRMLDPEV